MHLFKKRIQKFLGDSNPETRNCWLLGYNIHKPKQFFRDFPGS